ncbi:hypothetical protein DDD63_00685 [Actinobaculum sp. 313]|nr:hypothetical protein DDD63_00685 [Actinobaculum sp. 313]
MPAQATPAQATPAQATPAQATPAQEVSGISRNFAFLTTLPNKPDTSHRPGPPKGKLPQRRALRYSTARSPKAPPI